MTELFKKLRTARENAGLSQGQVAKILGIHRPTISEIEVGRRKVSSDELAEFSNIYDVSIQWLMSSEESSEFEDKVRLAARGLSRLKKKDLNVVINLLSTLKRK